MDTARETGERRPAVIAGDFDGTTRATALAALLEKSDEDANALQRTRVGLFGWLVRRTA